MHNSHVSCQCAAIAECLYLCAQMTVHYLRASLVGRILVFSELVNVAWANVARLVCIPISSRGCVRVEIPLLVRFGHDRESNLFHMATNMSTTLLTFGLGQHFSAENAHFVQ